MVVRRTGREGGGEPLLLRCPGGRLHRAAEQRAQLAQLRRERGRVFREEISGQAPRPVALLPARKVHASRRPQLEQVLQNLLANAIRYRGTDPPAIHVHGAEGAGEWILSVEDNGVGIPADALERVFDPFRRLASPDRAGSGLGLAICRQIVERHGGRIWAESLPRGTAFRFALPVVPSAGTAP